MSVDINKYWREKLDGLKKSIPGYQGSAAEQWNEQHYQIYTEMLAAKEAREAADPEDDAGDEDTTPNIIFRGSYKIK